MTLSPCPPRQAKGFAKWTVLALLGFWFCFTAPQAQAGISSFTLSSYSVVGTQSVTGTIVFSGKTTITYSVSLSSNPSTLATVPATVTGKGGQTVNFTITTYGVSSISTVNISATSSGNTINNFLTLNPEGNFQSFAVSPSSVPLYGSATLTLTLTAPRASDYSCTLGSSPDVLNMPATITVPAGQTSASVSVSSTDFHEERTNITIRAHDPNSFAHDTTLTLVPSEQPYPNFTPNPIPGRIEAENYDYGGAEVAYHDTDASNVGGYYRANQVDLRSGGAASNGVILGWTRIGEWLKYTVNVAQSGVYDIAFFASNAESSSTCHLEMDGANVTGMVTLPQTVNWDTFTATYKTSVSLTAGQHTLRLVWDGSNTIACADLDYIDFTLIAPPNYLLTDLGTLPNGQNSHANALNDLGQAVGASDTTVTYTTGVYTSHAFLWDAVSGIRDIGTLNFYSGSYYGRSEAFDINNRGQIVGDSWLTTYDNAFSPQYVPGAFLSSNGNRMQDIGNLGSWNDPKAPWISATPTPGQYSAAYARGINGAGIVTGFSDNYAYHNGSSPNTYIHNSYTYDTNTGARTALAYIPYYGSPDNTRAFAINASGQVVGDATQKNSFPQPTGVGALFNTGSAAQIAVLSACGTLYDINDAGYAVGFLCYYPNQPTNNNYYTNAVLWKPDAPNATTGTNISLDSTSTYYDAGSEARGINASGVIVGKLDIAAVRIPSAAGIESGTWFRFSDLLAQGKIQNGSGWQFRTATDINALGQIVGTGTKDGYNDRAFLLSPVITPTLISLSPNIVTAGRPGFTLTANGTNFLAGSTLLWNGGARSTTVVSPTQLTASISSNDIAYAFPVNVSVQNPAFAGGITSNALPLTLLTPGTTVGTLTFEGIASNAPSQDVTFTFRPNDASGDVTQTISITANGSYYLTGLPRKAGVFHIKSAEYLASNINVDFTGGYINTAAPLRAGDATHDNTVNFDDFLLLLNAYDTANGQPDYDANADVNLDGSVNFDDFLLILNNFDTTGDL